MKFKVGDKVRCINDEYATSHIYRLQARKSYRIAEVVGNRVQIKGNNVCEITMWNPDRFEKVLPNPRKQ